MEIRRRVSEGGLKRSLIRGLKRIGLAGPAKSMLLGLRLLDPRVIRRRKRMLKKIDVEGHETAVLSSMAPETMRKRVDSVVVEVHLYKFSKPVEELRRVCSLVSVVGPPEFLILSRDLNPGYRRLWWHVTKRYPVLQLPVPEVLELVKAHSLPELHVLARRGGIS